MRSRCGMNHLLYSGSRILSPIRCITSEQVKRWQQLSPAERLARQHYWRAKRLNGGKPNGFWTASQWLRLCARADWRCAYCGTPTRPLSPDHIQPLSKGGTNDLTNIAPVCLDCQRRKGAQASWDWLAPEEYAAFMQWLHPGAPRDPFTLASSAA